jgi:hypothetical protein
MTSSSGRICDHRALYTGYIIRQEYSEGPDNIDLRYSPLLPTVAPMIVHQNSACVSLGLLNVRLPLILVNPNPGIAESLLIVSMSTVDLV